MKFLKKLFRKSKKKDQTSKKPIRDDDANSKEEEDLKTNKDLLSKKKGNDVKEQFCKCATSPSGDEPEITKIQTDYYDSESRVSETEISSYAESYHERAVSEATEDVQLPKYSIDEEDMKNKICLLLEHYLNSREDNNIVVANRQEVKDSVINFINSLTASVTSVKALQQTDTFEENIAEKNDFSAEPSQVKSLSKKCIDHDSISSMNFLSDETRSISFNLDRTIGAEYVLSVINAIQTEFMKFRKLEILSYSDAQIKSVPRVQEKSESKIDKIDSKLLSDGLSKSSVESNKRILLSDRDHLNNMFDFLQDKINSLVTYEKETIISMGQILLDVQQFNSLIDLLKKWAENKLNKLSDSMEKLETYVSKVLSGSQSNSAYSRRNIKIVLKRKTNSTLT